METRQLGGSDGQVMSDRQHTFVPFDYSYGEQRRGARVRHRVNQALACVALVATGAALIGLAAWGERWEHTAQGEGLPLEIPAEYVDWPAAGSEHDQSVTFHEAEQGGGIVREYPPVVLPPESDIPPGV